MVIDCHVHLNNYHHEQNAPTEVHLARLKEQMAKWNLEHAIVITSYTVNQERPSAQRVAELIRDDPRLHLVEGIALTGPEPTDVHQVEERIRAGTVRALKLYPGYDHIYPYDRPFRPFIELAGKHGLPVMFHTGDTYDVKGKIKYSHPIHIDELCVDYPDINFVLCHLGNPWLRTTAEIIYKNHNAYTDISGLTLEEFEARMEVWMKHEVGELLLYAGEPDRILYGTDWPLVRMGPYLRFVDDLDLEPEVKRLLLRENAARLFGIETAGNSVPSESTEFIRSSPVSDSGGAEVAAGPDVAVRGR